MKTISWFWGVTTTRGTVLKGLRIRKAKNGCSRGIALFPTGEMSCSLTKPG